MRGERAGGRCLDLTAGLGVDSWWFAKTFDDVTAVEPDELLVALAEHNFAKLGVENVSMRRTTAEEFVASYEGPPFDLVFVDPDRRDESGKRVFALDEGSPNVVTLAPKLRVIGRAVLVKASPMCDVAEGARVLPDVRTVTVSADATECKEVLFELGGATGEDTVPHSNADAGARPAAPARIARFRHHGEAHGFASPAEFAPLPVLTEIPTRGWLLEPNVAIYKAGLFEAFASGLSRFPGARTTGPNGYVWTPERPADFPGKRYRIERGMPFRPSILTGMIRERAIERLQYTRKNFDRPITGMAQTTRVPEGGNRFAVFTRIEGPGRAMFLATLTND